MDPHADIRPAQGAEDHSRQLLAARDLWRWTTLAPLLAVAVVFVLTIFDPFEFDSVTKRQSATVFYKLYAPAYPTAMRDNIAVVLLDDDTLVRFGESWPPSHLVHGNVLSAILSYHPAAVLVDIFFTTARDNDHFDDTEHVIDRYNEQKVPLFLIAAGASTRAPRPARPELQRLADQGKVTLVSAEIKAEPGEAPLYPLRNDSSGEPAALALYDVVRDKLPGAAHDQVPEGGAADMEVVWGLQPAAFNCQRAIASPLERVCDDLFSSVVGRAIQLLWEAVIPRDWRPTDPMPLPYHATISTEDLLDGGKRSTLEPWLSGKVVIYGAHIALIKDLVFSPVHGNVDGAFIHAIALDNLLTFGKRYIHQGAGGGTFRKEWTEFQPSALMLLASVAVMWHRRWLIRAGFLRRGIYVLRETDERFLRWARWLLIGTIMVAGLIEFFVLRISPFNWLGLLIAVHIAHWIDRWCFGSVERAVAAAGRSSQRESAMESTGQ